LLGLGSRRFRIVLRSKIYYCFSNDPVGKLPAQGNVLPTASKVLVCATKGKFRLDAAKPAYQAEKFGRAVSWNDSFVEEIRRGLIACRLMYVHSLIINIFLEADF
jgi:hypothetical protein